MRPLRQRARALTLCAKTSGPICTSIPGIWTTETRFFYCQKFLRKTQDDSGRSLDGFLTRGYSYREVVVQFQHDNKHPEPYAGEVTFQDGSEIVFSLVKKIHKAWMNIKSECGDVVSPELLIKKLKALVVEYDSDIGEYYPGIQPGDPPLTQLARQA